MLTFNHSSFHHFVQEVVNEIQYPTSLIVALPEYHISLTSCTKWQNDERLKRSLFKKVTYMYVYINFIYWSRCHTLSRAVINKNDLCMLFIVIPLMRMVELSKYLIFKVKKTLIGEIRIMQNIKEPNYSGLYSILVLYLYWVQVNVKVPIPWYRYSIDIQQYRADTDTLQIKF